MQFTSRGSVSKVKQPAEAAPVPAPETPPQTKADYALVSQIGAELSVPINRMREIVHEVRRARGISRVQIGELTAALEAANQIARQSQQIARLAEGRLRQSHERIHLDQLLLQALEDLAPDLEAQDISVRHNIKPVEVIVDPGLLSSLIDAALSWGYVRGQRLMVSLSIKNWPEHAMLAIKATSMTGQVHPDPQTDSLNWHLLTHTAQTMGVMLEQEVTGKGESKLVLEFARTVRRLEGLTALEIDTSGDSSFHHGTKPMAGLRVLLICEDTLVRGQVEEASRLLGLMVDTVPTVPRALRYVELDMPHLIVIDGRLRDEQFDDLVEQIQNLEPNLGFLEISDDSNTFEISSWMGTSITRISRHALRKQLPSVLTLELARIL